MSDWFGWLKREISRLSIANQFTQNEKFQKIRK